MFFTQLVYVPFISISQPWFSRVYRLCPVHFLRCCETLVHGAKDVVSRSRSECITRMRGSFIILRRFTLARAGFVWSPSIFATRIDAAAAAAPFIVSLSYDAVVGTLLKLHSYFNISMNHNDPKQLFTTSKIALNHLCRS